MKHRIRRATHGDVEGHGVEKCCTSGDATWQNALVALLIVFQCVLDNQFCGVLEELDAIHVSSQDGTIARQRESDGFGKRVHRIGSEHTRARTATWTGAAFDFGHLFVGHRWVGTLHHRGDEVGILAAPLASLHGASAAEDGRNVQTHGSHQHARSHLVAVRDADHRISLVRIHHVFHRVGNDVARRQRVEHAVVTHGNAVIDSNGIELSSIAAEFLDLSLHNLADLVQMCMTWHKLGKGVDDGNNGFAEHFTLHTISDPQGAGTRHPATLSGLSTSELNLHFVVKTNQLNTIHEK